MRGTLQQITAPLAARLPNPNGVPARRLIGGALLAALLFHLLACVLFVLLSQLWPDRPAELVQAEAPAPEIQIEIVPPPPPPPISPSLAAAEIPPVIDADGLEKSDTAPKTTTFQSSQNMIAGSEKPANGTEALPSQDGADLPFTQFKNQQATLGKPADAPADFPSSPTPPGPPLPPLYKPKPLAKQYLDALAKIESSTPQTGPTPSPADPVPEPIAQAPDTPPPPTETAMLKPEDTIPLYAKPAESPRPPITEVTPPIDPPKPRPIREAKPAATPPTELAMMTKPPSRPQPVKDPGYQPETRQTRIEGSISNRGRPGVDAIKTPLGVYRQTVSSQIGAFWTRYTKSKMDLFSIGTVRIRFFITKDGRVQNVEILERDSNHAFANICEQSVRDAAAEIKPPPDDLEMMKDGRLEFVFSFTLY